MHRGIVHINYLATILVDENKLNLVVIICIQCNSTIQLIATTKYNLIRKYNVYLVSNINKYIQIQVSKYISYKYTRTTFYILHFSCHTHQTKKANRYIAKES